MNRYLYDLLKLTPASKIILLSGPRQVGKTTLVRSLFSKHEYLNWDNLDHRRTILDRSWPRSTGCVIFDELHKMPRWKGWLKGVYDVEKERQRYVVTGSARLNTYRKVGDSLAGRFFGFTLHPFDLKEGACWYPKRSATSLLSTLMSVGGFPEPFLSGKEVFYKKWRKSHLDIVLKQDLIDLSTVQTISKIELLIEHLRSSVGSPISFNSISEDLQVSDNTVRTWVQLLEDLFIIFRVKPFSRNVKRAILKAPKIYFYDTPLVNSGDGGAFENLVGCALLKEIDFRNDSGLGEFELRYLRDKDGSEVDFLVVKDSKPILMIEAKTSDTTPSKSFKTLGAGLDRVRAVQVVLNTKSDKDYPFGVSIRVGTDWLKNVGSDL